MERVDNIAETEPKCYKFLFMQEGRDESEVLEKREEIKKHSFIIRDEYRGGFIHFDCLASYNKQYQFTEYLTHEMIFEHQVQKPKFDMDGGDIAKYNTIKETTETVFYETYNIVPEFIECDSSNDYKFSRHIIICNAAFTNSAEAAHFYSLVCEQLPKQCVDVLNNVIKLHKGSAHREVPSVMVGGK